MGKIIYYTRLFLLMWLLFSCGTNNFTKRKYMKGVYVEKRTHVKTKKEALHQAQNKKVRSENERMISSKKKAGCEFKKEPFEKRNETLAVNDEITEKVENQTYSENNQAKISEEKHEEVTIEPAEVSSTIGLKEQKLKRKNHLGLISLIIILGIGIIVWALASIIGFYTFFICFLIVVPLVLSSIAIFRHNRYGTKSTDYKCALAALIISVIGLALILTVLFLIMFAY